MNPLPPDESRLEAVLRQEAPDLPDDGFTLRVMAVLPPRRPALISRRAVCCAVGAAAGVVLALYQGATWPSANGIGDQANRLALQAAAFLANPWTTVALVAVASATFLAWRSGDVEGA
jgi:hypothetical protein